MDDYIKREDARRMVVSLDKYVWTSPVSDERRVTVDVDLVKFGLDRIPAADVAEVVHGQWVDNGIPDSILSGCSVCGFTCGSSSFFYCPNCGAKMDGGERK